MAEQSRLSVVGWFVRAFVAGFGTVLGLFCGAGVIGGILFLVTFGAPQLVHEDSSEYVAGEIAPDRMALPDYGLRVEFAQPEPEPTPETPRRYADLSPLEPTARASDEAVGASAAFDPPLNPQPSPLPAGAEYPTYYPPVQEASPPVPSDQPLVPVPPTVEVIEVEVPPSPGS